MNSGALRVRRPHRQISNALKQSVQDAGPKPTAEPEPRPSPLERQNLYAVWFTAIASFAAAVAAAMSVKMASQQEDATYRSIVVAHEIDAASVLSDRASTFVTSVLDVHSMADYREGFEAPSISGQRAKQRKSEVSSVSQNLEHESTAFKESKTAIEQLQLLLPDTSRSLAEMRSTLELLDIEVEQEAQFVLSTSPPPDGRGLIRPENLAKNLSLARRQVSAFSDCSRSFISEGRPLEPAPLDNCVRRYLTQGSGG